MKLNESRRQELGEQSFLQLTSTQIHSLALGVEDEPVVTQDSKQKELTCLCLSTLTQRPLFIEDIERACYLCVCESVCVCACVCVCV